MSINIGMHDVVRVVIDREISLFKDKDGNPTNFVTDIRVYDSNNEEHVVTLYANDKSKPITIKNEVE